MVEFKIAMINNVIHLLHILISFFTMKKLMLGKINETKVGHGLVVKK